MAKRKKTEIETTTPALFEAAAATEVTATASQESAAPADDLVEDDGEMVTRAEREGRQKLRRELAATRGSRKKAPSPATEAEIEKTLDQVDPGWRTRKAKEKAAKDADKAARGEKRKAERAVERATSGKTTRPEHSNTETPTPAAEDKGAPEVDRTMARLQVRWCAALERAGKTKTTVSGYKAALQTACDHFGDSTPVASLTARKVENYNASDAVTKKRNGKAAAKSGIEKTRRALRLALEWAVLAGWIPAVPGKTDAA